jgi:hypothetical protein
MQHAEYGKRVPVPRHPGLFSRMRQNGSRIFGFYYRDSRGRAAPEDRRADARRHRRGAGEDEDAARRG